MLEQSQSQSWKCPQKNGAGGWMKRQKDEYFKKLKSKRAVRAWKHEQFDIWRVSPGKHKVDSMRKLKQQKDEYSEKL